MRFYNTATKKVEEFQPSNPENVKVYTCGPTVYDYAHVGNLTSYIYWDLLVRALVKNGYKVDRVLNATDVGHLSSDADEGEDKLEKGASREHKTVWEIAEKYIDAFLLDFRSLNLLPPTKFCRATDYIEQDEELVQTLIDKGFTYETKDGVYFDTSKFPEYGKFAGLDLENLRAGARVGMSEKRNKTDFAVWKFIQPGEDHAMRWDFLGRPGYPGWHLECSTIIHTELGEPIDIHTGGIDHIPVHHTNEIAQTKAAYGVDLAKYWLHCNFIMVDGQKISKSIGNIYTLTELAEKYGIEPLDFKMWVLSGHYQGTRNFSIADLEAAKVRRLKWRNAYVVNFQKDDILDHPDFVQEVLDAVSNNLNSAEAFALIDEKLNGEYLSKSDWKGIEQLFGLELESFDISEELKEKIVAREEARVRKDFAAADSIRDELAKKDITVLDTVDGPLWQYTR